MSTNEEKKILTKMQFEIGELTRKDNELGYAKMFYREAAEKGDPDAQNNLGVTYERADEYDKAVFWYKQAGDGGSKIALVNLGKMYEYGRGTKIDIQKAATCYKKAMDLKFDEGYGRLGLLYVNEKIEKNNKIKGIQIWLDGVFHANGSCQESAFRAGYAYESGDGVEQDYAKALWLYKKSASFNDEVANYNIGQIYRYGHGVEANAEKAMNYYLASAKRGYTDAMYALGLLFYDKEIVKRNDDIAMFWFTYSAEKGHLRGMLASAELWLTGEICRKNKKAAFNVLMDFLTTVESDNEELIDEYKRLRKEIDDKEFWDDLDYSYDKYCEKHNLCKIGDDESLTQA